MGAPSHLCDGSDASMFTAASHVLGFVILRICRALFYT